jgi:regulator of sigma E protease
MLESDEGWRMAIAFSVFFNVNLAIMNMLPFPVLDGGHIALAIAEAIRRKPIINIRALEIVQTAGAVALIAFMLYVSFFDVGDFFGKKHQSVTPAAAPAVKAEPAK